MSGGLSWTGAEDAPSVDDRALADLGKNDLGNGERYVARHGCDIKYSVGLGLFVWDAKRWEIDEKEFEAQKRAHLTARAIVDEAKALMAEADAHPGNGGDVKTSLEAAAWARLNARAESHFKFASATANMGKITSMIDAARPYVKVRPEHWNAQSDLFNCGNGTLDLTSLEPRLRAHKREDFITHLAGCDYDPAATCPLFDAFLEKVLPDPEVRAFVMRCLGVCLTDSVRDHALIVFHGGGRNGKSTLLNAVAHVLGDYCMTVDVSSLLYSDRGGGDASPDIARLAERPRLVRASEPEQGARLAEGAVKGITGGEPVLARKLREAPIEFRPNFKVFSFLQQSPLHSRW